MGEIAEMMLDGTMCQFCGVFLHDGEDGDGIPASCGCDGSQPRGDGSGKKRRRKRQRARRAARKRETLEQAKASGALDGWEKKSEHHFQIKREGFTLNHWPSTEVFNINGGRSYKGDAAAALKMLDSITKKEQDTKK